MARSSPSGITDVGSFGEAYTTWRERPFPAGSSTDALDELHADLALADTWVAESVVPFVERGLKQPAEVDVVGELSKLRDRAVELGSAATGEDARLASEYRDYIDLLVRAYTGFLGQP